ncbi:MAG: UDP-N-acetylglucosamine 2-epimerase (non-hydrolyzing) [Deltaproteobacteria bacterium]|nr:UDP-N-acetylglucosamine 2-epimerase (non-hydrolyzing) [Deltaproteobacteria bacterium]
MLIHLICAARPNFMKIAPLYHALKDERWAQPMIVHTGQHYDLNMSDAFFEDLGLPQPDIHLGIGSGTHAEQTGNVMIAYEKILMEKAPDLVVVVGDVNSTAAATIAAVKLGIKVAHLEAGLRSFDRRMPEEINRLVTDVLADLLWTPSPDADQNLLREGVKPDKIKRVGNIMLDSLEMMRPKIEAQNTHQEFDLASGAFGVVTLHRPSNVDDEENLGSLCNTLQKLAAKLPLVFPAHPRTRKKLGMFGLLQKMQTCPNLIMPDPMPYIRFMSLVFQCKFVITDSGGIQEETSYIGVPCLTVRENTERPITITHGTNQLCRIGDLQTKAMDIINGSTSRPQPIELWDGNTAKRIIDCLKEQLNTSKQS